MVVNPVLRVRDRAFGPQARLVMAIVNRTTDSFYDKGATWEDVTLVVSQERLRVEVWSRGDLEVDRTLGYGEAGFVDRREMKPNVRRQLEIPPASPH